ncbi:MAG: hypothetical protein ACI32C_05685 [Candidatus Enteromonas sp.]
MEKKERGSRGSAARFAQNYGVNEFSLFLRKTNLIDNFRILPRKLNMNLLTLISLLTTATSPPALSVNAIAPTDIDALLPDIISALNEDKSEKGLPLYQTSAMEYFREFQNSKNDTFYYVDLKQDYGYLLLKQDGGILWESPIGDLPEIRYAQDISFEDSHFLLDGIPYYPSQNSNTVQADFEIGVGEIAANFERVVEYNDALGYLKEKYGSSPTWSITSSGKLHGLSSTCSDEGYLQYDESVYISNSSEGNCGLVSTSNALAYYSRHGGYSLLPNYDSLVSIRPNVDEPDLVYAASLKNYHPKADVVYLHEIYAKEREQVIPMEYVCGGMNDSMTKAAYEGAASHYGYAGHFEAPSTFTMETIRSEIASSHPIQFRTKNDILYGGHGLMVTGYREYQGEEWIQVRPNLKLYKLTTVPMLSVFDGWSKYERWYDLTCFSNAGATYHRADSQTIALLHLEA